MRLENILRSDTRAGLSRVKEVLQRDNRDNRRVCMFWMCACILTFRPHSQLLESCYLENSVCCSHDKLLFRNFISVHAKIPCPLSPYLLFPRKYLISGRNEESLWLGKHLLLIRWAHTLLPDSAMIFCSPGLKYFFLSNHQEPPNPIQASILQLHSLPSSLDL